MAVVLDATPGSATANSFATVQQADVYNANQLYGDAWAAEASADRKAQALITATRLIVESVSGWLGWPVSSVQSLPHPRSGVLNALGNAYLSTSEIATALVEATSEYARRLLEVGTLPDVPLDSQANDLKSLQVGSVKLEFAGAVGVDTSLPSAVFSKIAFMIDGAGGAGVGRTSIPLIRT